MLTNFIFPFHFRRYFFLITFRSYLYCTSATAMRFTNWMDARPELGHLCNNLKIDKWPCFYCHCEAMACEFSWISLAKRCGFIIPSRREEGGVSLLGDKVEDGWRQLGGRWWNLLRSGKNTHSHCQKNENNSSRQSIFVDSYIKHNWCCFTTVIERGICTKVKLLLLHFYSLSPVVSWQLSELIFRSTFLNWISIIFWPAGIAIQRKSNEIYGSFVES